VLVAEGENPVSIPILRSLARKGLNVAVMTSLRRFSLSRFSKYCGKQILVPSTALEKEYAYAVEKIVRKIKFEVLFPIFEWSLIPISKNRETIGRYVKLPIASHESILKCFDKLSTLKLALENDVPIPKTFFVQTSFELKKVAKEIAYPAVVKPRWSMVWVNDKAFHRRSGFVNSAEELIATYNCIHQYFSYPLIQEYVPGINYTIASLYNKGKPKAFCCIRVHRAWPPTGGNSCFRETVKLDVTMRKYAEKLLEALDWHGIAEVEFRLDIRDNVPKLMEINPRFWGSLCVAIRAGVDFPYLLYRIAMDGDVGSVFNYKIGVKGRYFAQDFLYIVSMFKDISNNFRKNHSNLNILIDWLRFYEPGVFYDLFEWDDPLPFFLNTALSPLGLMRYLGGKNYAGSPPGVRL
jgi:predicted ATP-grasp superfamily ATP-dependent carboligase